jgi:phosphoribosylanthranilate isomerase
MNVRRHLWVKVCGMTSPIAVEAALSANVDAIGFVFAPSIRRVTVEAANRLAEVARGRVACVAVMLHPTAAEVADVLTGFRPDVLQTDAADLPALSLPEHLDLLPVVRAGGVMPEPLPARILFEGPKSGTGIAADWQRAAELAPRAELVLAGGLHCDNVAAAITAVRPFGVDVSSGVESVPGAKSAEKILNFVATARGAARGEMR